LVVGAQAEIKTLTFQQGLNGYDGVQDTFLYAPDSVANVNYGNHPTVATGINRWGENLVTLIRFDLSDLPAEAKVLRASLFLFDTSKEWPNDQISVSACLVAPANAGWIAGHNEGVRIPQQGTSCWNWMAYNTRPWAGAPGLVREGTDYLVPPVSSITISKEHEGWIEFDLSPDTVQGWLGQPANAGLRIAPTDAKEKGHCVVFRSSDNKEDLSTRPKLVFDVEMSDKMFTTFLTRHLARSVKAQRRQLAAIVQSRFADGDIPAGRPRTLIRSVEKQILKMERTLYSRRRLSEKKGLGLQKQIERLDQGWEEFTDDLVVAELAMYAKERWHGSEYALSAVDSMTNVLREIRKLPQPLTDTAHIEMARNEFESIQIALIPVDADIQNATWTVTDLSSDEGSRISASDVTVHVMGYMKSIKPAIVSDSEWWPVPILDSMSSVDVNRGQAQPLWVTIRTREDTPSGLYRGVLEVSANRMKPRKMNLSVEVWDFAIPKEQHLLTVWGITEADYRRLYRERFDTRMAREMFDFLIDHRLSVTTLYSQQAAGEPKHGASVGYPTLSDPAELKRLWDAGSRWWNLGYIHPVFADRAGKSIDDYVPDFIEMIEESLRVADAAGWPRSNMMIYFFDETHDFESLNRVATKVKTAFPDIPLMTTGYDRSYGVKGGPIDSSMDIWCPLSPTYLEDLELIEKGRAIGKKAWWYVCCVPKGGNDLNFFCQFPAIRSRLLMGTAAWKYKPDGFLYYRVAGWNHYEKPIETGPLTEWKPYFLPGPDGDGELICPGPNGALTTLQFENIRDGIEDYEYYWVLQELIVRAQQGGLDVGDEVFLLDVPTDLLETITVYSEHPKHLRQQRRKIAEAILKLKKMLDE